MKKAILLIVLSLCQTFVWAQFAETTAIRDAQMAIMELRFNDARMLLKTEKEKNPNNRFVPYLQSNIAFLAQFLSNNPQTLDSTISLLSAQLEAVEKSKDKKSFYYRYCLAELNFEMGALYLQDGSNWKAAWSMLEALDQIQANQNAPANFLPQQFMNGILNVTMGSLPKRYKIMARLFGYSGDVTTGINQMHRSTQTENTSFEGFKRKFVFAYGYTRSVLYERDSINVWDLDSAYADSPLLVYIQARLFTNQGENEAIITLLESKSFNNRYPFIYLEYMLGKAKLNRLDLDADVPFKTFLKDFKGLNAVKASNRYLSWHYFLQGDMKKTEAYKSMVVDDGTNSAGADQMALFDVKLQYNKRLIKARLYFDGGYYDKALKELDFKVNDLNADDLKMEYFYRKGRVLQKLNKPVEAIRNFEQVFTFHDSDAKRYFAANSALQLGLLYQQNNRLEQASKYFSKVMDYEDFPFEDGTHQKAKAGLQNVKNLKSKI